MRRLRIELLVDKIIAEKKLWMPYYPYISEIIELATRLKVPARKDCVQNFVAAYMVVRGLMSPRTADRVVASSARGRRYWQKKLVLLFSFEFCERFVKEFCTKREHYILLFSFEFCRRLLGPV